MRPPRGRRPLRAVLSGYYGFGNLGDEAILAGLLAAIRHHLPEASVHVLSGDPSLTREVHGVQASGRGLLQAWRSLGQADVLISGGGGLLQDVTSPWSPLYYLAVMAVAAVRGVPVVWWGQGVGPLRRRPLRWLAGWAARCAAAVAVRDEDSRRELAAAGVDPHRVEVVGDAAWLLGAPEAAAGPSPTCPRLRSEGPRLGLEEPGPGSDGPGRFPEPAPSGEARVAVIWRNWPGQKVGPEAAGEALGAAARSLSERLARPMAVSVMALHPLPDAEPARRLARRAQAASGGRVRVEVRSTPRDPLRLIPQLAGFDGVVSVRLHGLILAALAGVPFVGIGYDPKVAALIRQLDWPLNPLDPARLGHPTAWEAAFDALLTRHGELAAFAADRRARLVEGARRAAARLGRTLREVASSGAEGRGPFAADPEADPREIAAAGHARRPADPLPGCEAPCLRAEVLGVPVHVLPPDEAAELAVAWARRDGSCRMRWIVTLNPEMVMYAQRDGEFRQRLLEADLLVPDGVGLVWAVRLLGVPAFGRVPGIELAERCLAELARCGLPVFFLGGEPGTAEAAARRLALRLPGLRVAGTHHGYFAPGGAEERALLDAIAAARPALLLVGMGSPRQERWLARHRQRLAPWVGLAMGVGGSLDVWAGRVRRAPALFRRTGTEWLFRLVTQPRRARRMAALPVFAGLVIAQALKTRVGGHARG